MKEKLKKLIAHLKEGLIEREEVVKLSLLTMLARENILIVGPPGTAKSEVARRLSCIIKDGGYFEYLLTKFTTPEEIFGPLSIKELKEDRFRRNTAGYMPDAKVAFLDEIFKANSSILNSLLTIINEKIYHNGKDKLKVPLISLVGASNELPAGDDELKALYDRFIMKIKVDYVDDVKALFDITNEEFNINKKYMITEDEIADIKINFVNVKITENIMEAIEAIRNDYKNAFKENQIEKISDRKFIKLLNLLKVSAFTNGRDEVNFSDLLLLQNCLWNDPKSAPKINEIITKTVKKYCGESGSAIDAVAKKSNAKAAATNGNFKGSGTEADPFLIENKKELRLSGDEKFSTAGIYFRQTADIDLSSLQNFEPLPSFGGHYDGSGFKIANLKIVSEKNAGLFETIEKGSTVKNIVLENVHISSKDTSGGIAAINEGTISECLVNGNLYANYSGGISGRNSGSIINCSFNGELLSKICSGGVSCNNQGTISKCLVSGNVSADSGCRKLFSGGISSDNSGAIIDCIVNGSIFSSSSSAYPSESYSGGISGCNSGSISDCSVSGSVSSKARSSASGGISAINRGTILNCLSISSISGYGGGVSNLNEKGNIFGSIVLSKDIGMNRRICDNKDGKLENNYAIDTLKIYEGFMDKTNDRVSNPNGANGESVNKNIFRDKNFYEINLKWDFVDKWRWDDTNKIPVPAGAGYGGSNESKKLSNTISQDLLGEQLKENIWL